MCYQYTGLSYFIVRSYASISIGLTAFLAPYDRTIRKNTIDLVKKHFAFSKDSAILTR